jgi:ribosome biogenesis GTPase A
MLEANGMLEHLAELVEELRLDALRPQLAACRRQSSGDSSIEVAVLGRFKAGKSYFLNSLTGRRVLPIGVVPLTAVVTRLRYGPAEEAEVRFLNGAVQSVLVPQDV